MPSLNILQKMTNFAWGQYSDDVGKALIHLGAAGWFLSAAAQLFMIANNKNIDKKEKKFLIPQEISDGIINVVLYYTICQQIKSAGEKLLETGRIMTQNTHNVLMNMSINEMCNSRDFIKTLAEKFRFLELVVSPNPKKKLKKQNLTDFFNGAIKILKEENVPEDIKKNDLIKRVFEKYNTPELKSKQIEILETAQKSFNKYKNGVGVITAVSASVLACNLITPIARNITANYFQKNSIRKDNLKQPQKQLPVSEPVYSQPVSAVFNGFRI